MIKQYPKPASLAKRSRLTAVGRLGLAVLLPVVLAACASMPGGAGDQTVVKRAQARWDALIAHDYESAYKLYSPGYRSATPLETFKIDMLGKRVNWVSATYRDHQCEQQACTVSFDLKYSVARPVPGVPEWDGASVVEDTWVLTSGQWWFVPQE